MRAWRVSASGDRVLEEVPEREPPPDGVRVRVQAAPVLSYLRDSLDGKLGHVHPPRPFVPGTGGVGVVEAVGAAVRHLEPGQRVTMSPHLVVGERVAEPAQILIGLTAMGDSPRVRALQAAWRDGTFAQVAYLPAAVTTPLPAALDAIAPERVAGLSKLAVPYGGLLRAGLAAGEVVIVTGATGYFGSAGVLLAVALGAAKVLAGGRDRRALDEVAAALGPRVVPVALSGDPGADARAFREAAGGPADLALDLVGRARTPAAASAALHALRRGGRLVLMGSAFEPLALDVREMLAQEWRVMGCFMFPPDAPARLAALVAAGVVDLAALRVQTFPLAQLEDALEAASRMRGLDLTVLAPQR